MLKRLSIIVSVLFFVTVLIPADEVNYCQDNETWNEWEKLVKKYPNDMDIHTIHALRIGLCIKVERGDITVEQATKIFESARVSIMNKKTESEIQKEKIL